LGPEDTLSAQVTVANDGWTIWVDFYAAFITPDGALLYLTPDGFKSERTPQLIDIRLDDGCHLGPAPVFEFELNEHVPPGDYVFAAALSRAREAFHPIGDIGLVDFTVEGL